jgi:hypothetical protein
LPSSDLDFSDDFLMTARLLSRNVVAERMSASYLQNSDGPAFYFTISSELFVISIIAVFAYMNLNKEMDLLQTFQCIQNGKLSSNGVG